MKTLHIIMPMAGEGSRFKEAGYTVPKPLINFEGIELYRRSLSSINIKDYNVDIKADFDNAKLAAGIYTVLYVRILNLFPIAVYALRIYLKARKALKEEKINEQEQKKQS